MPETIHIKLPDGSDKEFPKGTTALDLAKSISPRLADAAIAAKVSSNGDQTGEGAQDKMSRTRCPERNRRVGSLIPVLENGEPTHPANPGLKRRQPYEACPEFVLRIDLARFRNGFRRVVRYCPEPASSQ